MDFLLQGQMLQWWSLSLLLVSGRANLQVGEAVNVFEHFGDLGSVFGGRPHLPADWLGDYRTNEIFQHVIQAHSFSRTEEEVETVPRVDFRLEMCDDVAKLKEAYYRNYNIQGCPRPWRAFTGGWSNLVAARHFGLNSSYLTGDHGYVLVRLTRNHDLVSLPLYSGFRLNNRTVKSLGTVVPGQLDSVLEFFRLSGSHYISSYSTGDSLYQVFVFTRNVYEDLRRAMQELEDMKMDRDEVMEFFTPWRVAHMGRIMSSSGDISLEHWAERRLRVRMFVFLYSSLLRLNETPELLQQIGQLLDNRSMLSVELRSLDFLFTDLNQRVWFQEVLDNQLQLWDLNI